MEPNKYNIRQILAAGGVILSSRKLPRKVDQS